jgi:hypothetical protein
VKGSSCTSVSSLLLLSSSSEWTGGKRSDISGDSGDDGGGDCTRTLFTTFGFWKLVVGGGWLGLDRACSWCRNRSAEGGRADAFSGVRLGALSSSNGGTARGGAAGADGAAALRRNGLLELKDGCCAMAAGGRQAWESRGTFGWKNGVIAQLQVREQDLGTHCSACVVNPAPHPTRPLGRTRHRSNARLTCRFEFKHAPAMAYDSRVDVFLET